MAQSGWIAKITHPERIALARVKMERVVDHLLYLLDLHENNAIVVYSPTLAAQIPTSYAANAFNVFQRGMHQFEVVRLCALWDGADPDKENIPTVVELVDDAAIIEVLAQETAAHWKGIGGDISNLSDDPELRALEIEALQRSNEEFGELQAQRVRSELRTAIDDARAILASPKHASIMNMRDKHLAHSLSATRREKAGPVEPMKYGYERDVLNATLPIAHALLAWVNGKSFNFEDSRGIDRENAKALWEACTFKITR